MIKPVNVTKPNTTYQSIANENSSTNSCGGCWPMSSLIFMLSLFVHIFTGVMCLIFDSSSKNYAAGVSIPQSSMCFRATRFPNYATVNIAVGSPPVEMSLLLVFDSVLEFNDTNEGIRLFSHKVVESKTVVCSEDKLCHDIFVASDGHRDKHLAYLFAFKYRHASIEHSMGTVASNLPDVMGEFRIKRGYSYWLTPTHLCYGSSIALNFDNTDRVNFTISKQSKILVHPKDIKKNKAISQIPVASKRGITCANNNESTLSDVVMYPTEAMLERSWLSISNPNVYSTEPKAVDLRRYITEIGLSCAYMNTSSSEVNREVDLYKMDCEPYGACRTDMTVPFRQVGTASIFIDLQIENDYWMSIKNEESLHLLINMKYTDRAFLESLFNMAIVMLAALVVFIRSKKSTSSSSWLFKNCASIYRDKGSLVSSDANKSYKEEDIIIGFVAILARICTVILRFRMLSQDNNLRVCISEILGSTLSLIHWINRWFVLVKDNDEAPVSKLGGSTALIDSTSSVMLAFSESPMLAVFNKNFNPVARMLVSILISIIALTRCAFSAACCGILWTKFYKSTKRTDYAIVHLITSIGWCLQSATLSIIVCDLFVSPAAYSMSRTIVGNRDVLFTVRVTLFLCVVCVGLPRLMSTARHILSDQNHHID
jgi:hypothetical protein